jgi:hypothetical protein
MKDAYAAKSLKRITRFLDRPDFDGFTTEDLFIKQFVSKGWGQDIAALSNMAEAIRNLCQQGEMAQSDAAMYMNKIYQCATSPSVRPWKKSISADTSFGGHGYFLEHLNIILGCFQEIVDDRHLELNRRISEHLLAISLEHPLCHARLLPNVKMRWSADQAAVLYSVWLFDQNNQTTLHEKAAREWLHIMEAKLTHEPTGLFQTEALGVKRYSRQPRGCSSAYMIYYMSHFAPEHAALQWGKFKAAMLTRSCGMTGFREYLPDFAGKWTPDSGPIVAGIGVAASALAIKTAGAMGDSEVQSGLITSAGRAHRVLHTIGHIPGVDRLTRLATDLLASSIYLSGRTTRTRINQTALAA